MTDICSQRVVDRLLAVDGIRAVEVVEGRPGGPNNDAVRLTLEPDGAIVSVNVYSGGSMQSFLHTP